MGQSKTTNGIFLWKFQVMDFCLWIFFLIIILKAFGIGLTSANDRDSKYNSKHTPPSAHHYTLAGIFLPP